MEVKNTNTISVMHLNQIRTSHARALQMFLKFCNKYRKLKCEIENEEVKNHLRLLDRFFFDEKGKIEWNIIRSLMPQDIEKRIKKEHGILSDKEVKLCCLILFRIPCVDIADILPYSYKTVHVITHKIKQKTGMKNIKENLNKFLLP